MAIETPAVSGMTERLEDLVRLARRGKKISLTINLYRKLVKETVQSESTDDIPIASDMCLFVADFKPTQSIPDQPSQITKVYAMGGINETEINDRTLCYIANQRLDMDYTRLKDAGIVFETAYF